MGRPENLHDYVKVIRLLETLGGSEGHKADEAKFVQALATELPNLLPEDDDLRVQIFKHVKEPMSVGTPEQIEMGHGRYHTFYDFLTTIEQLGGSKGYEEYLNNKPDSGEVSPETKPANRGELWEKKEDCCMSLICTVLYANYVCRAISSNIRFDSTKWFTGQVDWFPLSYGNLSYHVLNYVKWTTCASLGGVSIAGGGLSADFYRKVDGQWKWEGTGFCGQFRSLLFLYACGLIFIRWSWDRMGMEGLLWELGRRLGTRRTAAEGFVRLLGSDIGLFHVFLP
ncbi:hypothetical protein DL96DRAFT_1626379 [Flagelloscypha sp. PMI_526]|nr:hypothetical protein DL96DRAFT_1626379 [Flagelloscypha sp. PMI_526]